VSLPYSHPHNRVIDEGEALVDVKGVRNDNARLMTIRSKGVHKEGPKGEQVCVKPSCLLVTNSNFPH
jgi:hypothetical protein